MFSDLLFVFLVIYLTLASPPDTCVYSFEDHVYQIEVLGMGAEILYSSIHHH
jgi:hypothetical protein